MAPKKVRVNSVNPGGVVTNLYKGTSFCPNEEAEKKVNDSNIGIMLIKFLVIKYEFILIVMGLGSKVAPVGKKWRD